MTSRALGEQLKLPWLFVPSERRWWHDDFGNGLLCKLPVESWLRIPMTDTQSRGHRNVLMVRVPWNGTILTILITHVDREADHSAQLRFLSHLLQSIKEPVVLMGDLNTEPSDPEMTSMLGKEGFVDVLADKNRDRVDWILARGLTAVDCGSENKGASDHPHVLGGASSAMTIDAPAPEQPSALSWRSFLIIAIYGASVLLIGLGDRRVLTRHEVLAAQPAREMLHDGHWIIPTFAGEKRPCETAGDGWTIALFMKVFESESEFVVRLPTVLAGLMTALLIASMTARWFDDRTGLIAGLLQLTTFYLLRQARLSEADMLMAACVTGAMWCLTRIRSPLPSGEGKGEGALKIESDSNSDTPSPQPSPEGRGGYGVRTANSLLSLQRFGVSLQRRDPIRHAERRLLSALAARSGSAESASLVEWFCNSCGASARLADRGVDRVSADPAHVVQRNHRTRVG